jgi:predicted secreted protein
MWICSRCNTQNDEDVNICPGCGAGKSTVAVDTPDIKVQTEPEDLNLFRALIFGLVASVVSAVVWYGAVILTGYQLGILAIGVGWLVATAVVLGSGGKHGPALQALSIVLIIITMAVSEYLILRHFVNEQIIKEGGEALPLWLPIKLMVEFVWMSIKESPLILLFWGIAVYEGYKIPSVATHELEQLEEEAVEEAEAAE